MAGIDAFTPSNPAIPNERTFKDGIPEFSLFK
jgi:hypothetical protein